MGNENTGRKMSKTVRHRKKLSDITNTPLLHKSRAYDENDQLSKESSAQLRDELADVKKMLAEKEEHIEENKRYMQKLWINYCRKTKQNDEIILHNSQLYKDLMQASDKLKILEHENAQMSALYKVYKSEMQQKLNEALEQVDRLTKLLEASRFEKANACKHTPVDSDTCKNIGLSSEVPGEGCTSIHGRSTLRKRQRKSYKEPSLKEKLRQEDSGEPVQCDNNPADQKLGKAEECEAVSPEIKISEGMSCSGENASHTQALRKCTGKGNVGKDQGVQLLNTPYVSDQKSWERPLRRAASSIGSYKEPPLNTKMRRAA